MRRFAQAPLILAVALACVSLLATGTATAAPYYGARFDLGQPDGSTVPVLVWDEDTIIHRRGPPKAAECIGNHHEAGIKFPKSPCNCYFTSVAVRLYCSPAARSR